MAVSYNKLWKLLIDKGMSKTQLMIMQRASFIPEDTHTEMTLTASLPAIETYLIFNLGSGILHSTHALVHKCS